MANHQLPAVTSNYTNFVAELSARFNDLALMLDSALTTPTNLPTNATRWNSTTFKFERWNGTAWGDLSATYAFNNITAAGSVTLSGGTANGVPYLNGSKVLTSGSALTFDGSKLGVNTTNPIGAFRVSAMAGYSSTDGFMVAANGVDNRSAATIYYTTGDGSTAWPSQISSVDNGGMSFRLGTRAAIGSETYSEQMRLTATGLGIGTTSPTRKLEVVGDIQIPQDKYLFFGSGTNNYIGASSSNITYIRGTSVTFSIGSSKFAYFDSNGNLSLGALANADWQVNYPAFQIGGSAFTDKLSTTYLFQNAYISATAGAPEKYMANGYASKATMSNGGHQWFTAPSGIGGNNVTFTQAMTLNVSGNLGIGTSSPGYKLDVSNGNVSGANLFKFTGATAGGSLFGYSDVGGVGITRTDPYNSMVYFGTGNTVEIYTASTQRAVFDSSGNLGLGVTPSVWTLPAFESTYGLFAGRGEINITSNANYNGGWKYISTGTAAQYRSNNGVHQWFSATSGTSGAAISFTQTMTLHASGGLSLGNTTDPGASNLSVSGTFKDGTAVLRPRVLGTSQATTSGTTKDFTGIPSWATKITIAFSGVSTSGSSVIILQLGISSGFETTGYVSTAWDGTNLQTTTGLALSGSVASGNVRSGTFTLMAMGSNVWVGSGIIIRTDSATGNYSAGTKTLAAALTQIRITTVNGTDTFDAGSVNILYE